MEISCLLAALTFTAANVLKILLYVKEYKRQHFDIAAYENLDPSYLQAEWDWRISVKGIFLASGFLNAVAWTFLSYPIIQMAWVLSKRGTKSISTNASIMLFAVGGAFTEWLSHIFWIGMLMAMNQLVNEVNLDNWVRPDLVDNMDGSDEMGWRCLEVNNVIGSGYIWFVDSFEWLCLSGLFISTFISVCQWRREDAVSFGARWNSLTLFIGLLSLLEFTAEILRLEGFRYFGPIGIIYATLNRLILMPAWILALGIQLPRAVTKQAYGSENVDSELALTEMEPTVQMSAANGDGAHTVPPEASMDTSPTPGS